MGSPEGEPKEKDLRIPYHHILRLQERVFGNLFEKQAVDPDDFEIIGRISEIVKNFANNPENIAIRTLLLKENYMEAANLMVPELVSILRIK